MREMEHRGDEITRRELTALARSIQAPIDREGIQALAVVLDDLVGRIKEAALRLAPYCIDRTTVESRWFARFVSQQAEALTTPVPVLGHAGQELMPRIVGTTAWRMKPTACWTMRWRVVRWCGRRHLGGRRTPLG